MDLDAARRLGRPPPARPPLALRGVCRIALDAQAEVVDPQAKLALQLVARRSVDPLALVPLSGCTDGFRRKAVAALAPEDVSPLSEEHLRQAARFEREKAKARAVVEEIDTSER